MSWTKRQLIVAAYAELGLGGAFVLSPEEVASSLHVLDAMMAEWEPKLRLGYRLPSSQAASDPDQDSGMPDRANSAVYLNLAVRRAPAFGKTLPLDTRRAAAEAYQSVLGQAVRVPAQKAWEMPVGAGNRFGTVYSQVTDDPLPVVDGGLDLGGQ